MSRFLLLGAGFTRNWGGPLASEMFNLLIGRKPINEMPVLRDALVRHRERGGFEAAFGEIQAEYERSHSPQSLAHLRGFQDAIAEVFSDLDGALSNATFEFQAPPDNSNELVKFLTAFDAIFSLNQDLMLERHYLDMLRVSLASGNRWNGWEFPGMRVQPRVNPGLADPAKDRWRPLPREQFRVSANLQPIFKMHGSTTWFDETGQIMVMGYNKLTTIQSQQVLKYYYNEFERCLSLSSARLVVIGYGFQDPHINTPLRRMISVLGPRMFIIDPAGVDVTDENRKLVLRPVNDFLNIIDGASTRSLREIFGGPSADYTNLMRFLGLHR
jgi:SIR2-like domain